MTILADWIDVCEKLAIPVGVALGLLVGFLLMQRQARRRRDDDAERR